MRTPLNVAVAQPECVAYDVAANAAAHASTIRSIGARVVVFPELSLTGYELDAPALSITDSRLGPVIQACGETESLALVGAPVHGAAQRAHIATLAVDGRGASVAYCKLCLSPDEARRFSPGHQPAVLEIDGWRLGLAICKDVGIPQHVSDTARLGIDAYVAGTLLFEEERAKQNDRARRIALEHHVWVVIASFAGPTGSGYTRSAGCSGIWSATGAVIAQAGPEAGGVVHATLT